MAQSYSIYETKAKLSEILRAVKAGKEVIVNERGRPIAKILPFSAEETFEARYQRLKNSGQIGDSQAPRHFEHVQSKPGALKRFLEERD